MATKEISVALDPGHDNAITVRDKKLFAPHPHAGLQFVGVGKIAGRTIGQVPSFDWYVDVPGAKSGDIAILNSNINQVHIEGSGVNKKDLNAKWMIEYYVEAGQVHILGARIRDGNHPVAFVRAMVLRPPTAPEAESGDTDA